MNRISFLFALYIFNFALFAQSNVDNLVRSLDSLGSFKLNYWKVSPDLKLLKDLNSNPTKPGFDDSKWQTLTLNERIYPDSCWLRKEIILPDNFLGQHVQGVVKFLISVDDYGYFFVNGESKGMFPWDGEFTITEDAKPGQKFLLAIKAINTGGPLRLIRAELSVEHSKKLQQTIEDFSLSLRVGQKLLSSETFISSSRKKIESKIDKSTTPNNERTQLNEVLQNSCSTVDIDALAKGNMEQFSASLEKTRQQLKVVSEFAKRFTLYFTSNAHIDAAWLWRDLETKEVCKNTFSSVFNMMNTRPDFTYTQSSAAYYDWMEKLYPDVFNNIKKRVNDGRWEIVGGMWVEPDCNLPSGESWARQLLYAQRYFKQKFGVVAKIGWNPDSFGYTWNMPQFYLNAGLDAFITQKIGWNETTVFPHRVFWWEASDGSRLLTYFPFDYVNAVDNPFQLVDWLKQFESNSGFAKMMVLFGVGDHGGGPSLDMLERIDRLRNLDNYPSIEYGTANAYIGWLRTQNLTTIPVWNDELYLEYHQGTYTTQAKIKEWNRKSEVLLTNAEKFSTLSTMFGGMYNNADMEDAWRNVLFNQFHDILPGSSIREVYIDATEKYKVSETIGTHELKNALNVLASNINTTKIKNGTPLIVFNPLSWERTDIVTVALPEDDNNDYAIFDLSGKELPSQILQKDRYHREIIFRVERIPSMGYSTFVIQKQTTSHDPNITFINSFENDFFQVAIDPSSGWVRSIVDKRNGKELLSSDGNKLQILEDKPNAWDAWNVGLTGIEFPSKLRKIELIEQGPVRSVVRITRDYLKPGTKKDFPTEDFPSTFFTQDIILYDGIDRIDFKTDVDWWETKTMLKVAFPLTVQDTVATYEIPYGTITRTTQWRNNWDSAKVEVPASRWADLSDNSYGISLLNKSKYGYDVKRNTIRLSLLRSPEWPDPTADRGKHSNEYSLFPHSGKVLQSQTVQRGYEYNYPLLAVMTTQHKGKMPTAHSFVQIEPASLVLTSIKKAEDSDAWVIQWYDAKGEGSEAELTLPSQPKNVLKTNFMEEDGIEIPFVKNMVKMRTEKNSITTIKVFF
ncbi:MAG: alpha-mannosidase [Ignavibacteriae bacterium]|nr:alpha-mannosidase [Ignavibacteriota bacterium]